MFKRIALVLTLGGILSLAAALPAQAAIHELVASWCSGNFQTLDPNGQERFGTQSFVRALQATGIYEIQFGVVPDGQPAPAPGTTPVTIDIDFDNPAAKFSAAPGYFVFVAEGLTVYIANGFPDHAAFEHCPNMPGG